MAEGFLREYAGNSFDIYSAGFEPKDEIHPYAKQVMREIGCDISNQYPKGTDEYLGRLLVTHLIIVCANAKKKCPRVFLGAQNRWYWPFDDPAAAEFVIAQALWPEINSVQQRVGLRQLGNAPL